MNCIKPVCCVEVGSICVQVQRAPIRNLYLTVRPPDATVCVRAPYEVSYEHIVAFVKNKLQWIDAKSTAIHQNPFCHSKRYVEGELYLIFGQPHMLHFESQNRSPSVYCIDGKIMICGCASTSEARARLLSSYLLSELQTLLDTLFFTWVNVMQLTLHSFTIRSLKHLWGSCHVIKRHITINSVLVHYPLPSIEYVVVHELVHLWEPSHNDRFYRLLEHYLPRWREQHSFLRRYPIGIYR